MLFEFVQKAAPTVNSVVARPKGIVAKRLFTDDDEHDYFKPYRYTSEAAALADTDGEDLEDEIRGRRYRDDDDLIDGHEYWYRFSSVDIYDNESAKSAPLSAIYRFVQTADVRSGDMTDQRAGKIDAAITVATSYLTVVSVTSLHGPGASAVTLIGQIKNNSGSDIQGSVRFTGDAQGMLEEWVNFIMPPRVLMTVVHLYANPTGSTSKFNLQVKLDTGSASIVARKIIAISNKR